MKGDKIYYRKGYKYQLYRDYTIHVAICGHEADVDFLKLTKDGKLTTKAGYAWDGPSGPTWDTLDSMRGSLVHDALCQLMRLGVIPGSYREYTDNLFKQILIEDEMDPVRAEIWRLGVSSSLADFASKAGNDRPILEAP